MTTPRPHAHAESVDSGWHYRDDGSEQQRHGFASAQLWWSEKQLAFTPAGFRGGGARGPGAITGDDGSSWFNVDC
jgi:hypothetical protein